jgi:hypothetical protein
MTGYTVRLDDSLDAFYREADPRLREFSGEVDFGVHWSDPLLPAQVAGWPRWRVAWVRETGEVYAVCQHPFADRRSVRLYGAVEGQEAAEKFLAGWEHHCRAGGLAWLEGLFEARWEEAG